MSIFSVNNNFDFGLFLRQVYEFRKLVKQHTDLYKSYLYGAFESFFCETIGVPLREKKVLQLWNIIGLN